MPTKVPIEIFNIARTEVDRDAVKRWLAFLGLPEFQLPEEEVVSNPALLVALAAKRCYKSFDASLNPNLSRVRADYAEYLDNVLKSGHGSVLEHSVYTFAIENVSRVFTGEMNRHRAGWAISEGSMRFIRFGDDIPYWEPTSVAGPDTLSPEARHAFIALDAYPADFGAVESLDDKKHATRLVLHSAFSQQQAAYRVLEKVWAAELDPKSTFKGKKEITSLLRRIVGMGCATGGVWTGNVRALRHVITMRCEPSAEEEILHVFSRVAKMVKDREPAMFGDFAQDEAGFWRPQYRKV